MSPIAAGEDPFPLRKLRKAGDGDPFPLRVSVNGQSTGQWVKGRGSYRALQVGPFVRIFATGTTSHTNATAHLVRSPLTVTPPIHGLFFHIPEISMPMEAPFMTYADFFIDDQIETVVVWDADKMHEVPVHQAPM